MARVKVMMPRGHGQLIDTDYVWTIRNAQPFETNESPEVLSTIWTGSKRFYCAENLTALGTKFRPHCKLLDLTAPNGELVLVAIEKIVECHLPSSVEHPDSRSVLYFSYGRPAPRIAVQESNSELRTLWEKAGVPTDIFDVNIMSARTILADRNIDKSALASELAALGSMDFSDIKFAMVSSGAYETVEEADEAEKNYKRFLALNKILNSSLVPAKNVDKFWHNHILDTRRYHQDMHAFFGHMFHHSPGAVHGPIDEDYWRRAGERSAAIWKDAFGEDFPRSERSICYGICKP